MKLIKSKNSFKLIRLSSKRTRNEFKIIRLSSKRTRQEALNVLYKGLPKDVEDWADSVLMRLRSINPSEEHLVYLAKYYLQCRDFKDIALHYKRFKYLKNVEKDISQFKSFDEFKKSVSSLPTREYFLEVLKLDKTKFKSHVDGLLSILLSTKNEKGEVNIPQVKTFYDAYVGLCKDNKEFLLEFSNFKSFSDLENFVDVNSKEVVGGEGFLGEADYVSVGDYAKVYYADSKEKAQQLSAGYGWCIGWLSNNQYYNYRLGDSERCFYFVKFPDRSEEQNNYIVIHVTKDGKYHWSSTKNDNGDPEISKENLIDKFYELKYLDFDSVFKYVPVSDEERKFAKRVSVQTFVGFDYDEKSRYIEFGHNLNSHQFKFLDKDQKSKYINTLNEFLEPLQREYIKDDIGLMSSYENRLERHIIPNIKECISRDGVPPSFAFDWAKYNLDPADFVNAISDYIAEYSIIPAWVEDWVEEDPGRVSDGICSYIRSHGDAPSFAIDWAKKNLDPKDFHDQLVKSRSFSSSPVNWAIDYCMDNGIGKSKEELLNEINNHIRISGYPPDWAKDWAKEDPSRVSDGINDRIAKIGCISNGYIDWALEDIRRVERGLKSFITKEEKVPIWAGPWAKENLDPASIINGINECIVKYGMPPEWTHDWVKEDPTRVIDGITQYLNKPKIHKLSYPSWFEDNTTLTEQEYYKYMTQTQKPLNAPQKPLEEKPVPLEEKPDSLANTRVKLIRVASKRTKLIRVASKRTKLQALNILKGDKDILGSLIEINKDEKHLPYLAKFYIQIGNLEELASSYRRFRYINRPEKDISQFKSFQEFSASIGKEKPVKYFPEALSMDETSLKLHVGNLIQILGTNSDIVQVNDFYKKYLEVITYEGVDQEFNFATFKDLESFVDKNYKNISGEFEDQIENLLETDLLTVNYASDENEAKKLSSGFGWCVGWEQQNQYYNYRLSDEERSFYFVRFKNRDISDHSSNPYIVVQRLKDGGLRWTNSHNDNDDDFTTESSLKKLFPELESINFNEVFKHVPLTEDEIKFCKPISDDQFENFNYEEKSSYINFGHELSIPQFKLCDKEQLSGYINRLREFLPDDMLELIKDDKSLMSTYERRVNGPIKKIVEDHIRSEGEPPSWAREWAKENAAIFRSTIEDQIRENGFPWTWAEEWAKKNLDPNDYIDVILSHMTRFKNGSSMASPMWCRDWVEKNAVIFKDAIETFVEERGFAPSWAEDWARENLDPSDYIKEHFGGSINRYILGNYNPPVWAAGYCIENGIGKSKEKYLKDINGHVAINGWAPSWCEKWVNEDPNRILNGISRRVADIGSVHRFYLPWVQENLDKISDSLKIYIKSHGCPPNWAKEWAKENLDPNDHIDSINKCIKVYGWPPEWATDWIKEDPIRVIDGVHQRVNHCTWQPFPPWFEENTSLTQEEYRKIIQQNVFNFPQNEGPEVALEANRKFKLIRVASKRTKLQALNTLNGDKDILGSLIEINQDEKHLPYLAKFYIQIGNLEELASSYRRFRYINRPEKDISQFRTFQEFSDSVSNEKSVKYFSDALSMDETPLKLHVDNLIQILGTNSDIVQVSNFYKKYLDIISDQAIDQEFNFATFSDLEKFVDDNYESISGEFEDQEENDLDNDLLTINYAKNENDAKRLSNGFGWCVGWEHDNQYYNYRLSDEERSFYFVRFKNRDISDKSSDPYIVVQRLNDGELRWTNSQNNNGDMLSTEDELKELFPELKSINFTEVFKHVPLTEDERKYCRSVSDFEFENFNYEEKSAYISFGHELSTDQFRLCDKEQRSGYINRLNRFLPETVDDSILDLIQNDKALMSTYNKRVNGPIRKIIEDQLRINCDPPSWAIRWIMRNIDPADFEEAIISKVRRSGDFPYWCRDWCKDNIDPADHIDVIKKHLSNIGDECSPPKWTGRWVNNNAGLFREIIENHIRSHGDCPQWSTNWCKENLDPSNFEEDIIIYIRDTDLPPEWCVGYCIDNGIGRSKEKWLQYIESELTYEDEPPEWAYGYCVENGIGKSKEEYIKFFNDKILNHEITYNDRRFLSQDPSIVIDGINQYLVRHKKLPKWSENWVREDPSRVIDGINLVIEDNFYHLPKFIELWVKEDLSRVSIGIENFVKDNGYPPHWSEEWFQNNYDIQSLSTVINEEVAQYGMPQSWALDWVKEDLSRVHSGLVKYVKKNHSPMPLFGSYCIENGVGKDKEDWIYALNGAVQYDKNIFKKERYSVYKFAEDWVLEDPSRVIDGIARHILREGVPPDWSKLWAWSNKEMLLNYINNFDSWTLRYNVSPNWKDWFSDNKSEDLPIPSEKESIIPEVDEKTNEVTANRKFKLIKVNSSKINLASKFKIIIASRSDFLKGLGASSDIINFIESLDDHGAQFLTNEFRKNPSLSLMELQSVEVPENRLAISNNEKVFVSRFSEGVQKWLIYELRKLIRTRFNIYPNSGDDYNTIFHQRAGLIFQDGLNDWYNNAHPDLDSLSLNEAEAQSKEWHDAMASGGAGKVYMTRDIVFGPEWKKGNKVEDGQSKWLSPAKLEKDWGNEDIEEKYNGWTIQEVSTENDLLVEGNLMKHCVGSYWDNREECIIGSDGGRNRIFSLRDPKNKPHVTIETDQSGEAALQIMGHSNSTPKDEYKEMIKFWVESGNSSLKTFDSGEDELHYATEPSYYISLDTYDTEVNEFLHSTNEYGLKSSETYQKIIDFILVNGLKQLILHNQRSQNFNFCLSDTLGRYVVSQGDEAIFYYLDKLQEYSDGAWEDFTSTHEMPPIPEREDFNSDEDYDSAVKSHEATENDLEEEHLLSAWNNCLHKDLIKIFKEVRGENLWDWHKKFQAEKERKGFL